MTTKLSPVKYHSKPEDQRVVRVTPPQREILTALVCGGWEMIQVKMFDGQIWLRKSNRLRSITGNRLHNLLNAHLIERDHVDDMFIYYRATQRIRDMIEVEGHGKWPKRVHIIGRSKDPPKENEHG